MTMGCVVLAAGRSSRMGANKLVAELGGRPIIAHVVDAIRDAGLPPPIVVLGNEPDAIRVALHDRDVRFIPARDHAEGIARSLAAGIGAVPDDCSAAIICLGDMPMLSPTLLRAMAARATASAIIVPMFEGRRGNPVLWGRRFFPRLTSLAGDVGAKTLLAEFADQITPIEWSDDSICIDIDEPAQLERARQCGGYAGHRPD